MGLNDDVDVARRVMVLFFLVDTSGSMSGSKIGAVNHAIEEFIPEIKSISAGNADVQIKIAVLEYSTGVRWITVCGPVEVDKFIWEELEAGGASDFGAACKALNEKLSTKAFMREANGLFPPVIFLFSDTEPTDNWQSVLTALKQNLWFKAAIKVAIAIGDDADHDPLIQFVGSKEGVITAHDPDTLKKWINFVDIGSY